MLLHVYFVVTGLDPAGPEFQYESDITIGLNSNDADLVDIIHTDTQGFLGGYGTRR